MGVTVSELFVYPVKSCAGISIQCARIGKTGFLWDRQWMVVNEKGRFITQRQEPRMALIQPLLPPLAFSPGFTEQEPNVSLVLQAPGMDPLHVPMIPPMKNRQNTEASVWEWSGKALDVGPEAAKWFSSFIGRNCRLVRFDPVSVRQTDERYATGFQTAFADGYPFLITSKPSLGSLNSRLKEPLPMNRFRPNLVVDGCTEFEEDMWSEVKIGEEENIRFHGVKPCSRCKVTTTDQETTVVGKEPLETLKTFRHGKMLQLPSPLTQQVFFGMNFVCSFLTPYEIPSSTISVGDELTILKKASSAASLLS